MGQTLRKPNKTRDVAVLEKGQGRVYCHPVFSLGLLPSVEINNYNLAFFDVKSCFSIKP